MASFRSFVLFLVATYAQNLNMTTQNSRINKNRVEYSECGETDGTELWHASGLIALSTMDPGETLSRDYNQESLESEYKSPILNDERTRARRKTGLCVAFGGGVCFGFFSPAFNIPVNDPFGFLGLATVFFR